MLPREILLKILLTFVVEQDLKLVIENFLRGGDPFVVPVGIFKIFYLVLGM